MSAFAFGWVALGGALGSVARAWIALVMTRVTGPAFPWGTIFINIAGSFIITFFGTLTVADGRLPASAEARAFVMVGLCGGFTTFSSFSLQTVDLVRTGRPTQAFLNIAISVVFCLTAAAAGIWGAEALNGGQARVHAAGGRSTGKVIVMLLGRPEAAPGVLAAAMRLIEPASNGHVEALAIQTPPPGAFMPTETVLTVDHQIEIRAMREDWAGQLKAILQAWIPEAQARGVKTDWIDVTGAPARIVAERGKRADVVVASRIDHQGERGRQALHAALFDTGCPVMVVPPGEPRPFGRIIAVAWQDDDRAPKAVLAAMPLLAKAEKVHLLQADEGARSDPAVPPIFAEHGIAPQCHAVPISGGATGARLLDAAHQVSADMLVMGAYAHGEWREAILGGVSRHMLTHANLPILMRH